MGGTYSFWGPSIKTNSCKRGTNIVSEMKEIFESDDISTYFDLTKTSFSMGLHSNVMDM